MIKEVFMAKRDYTRPLATVVSVRQLQTPKKEATPLEVMEQRPIRLNQ